MATTTTNLVMGPATLYIADFGVDETGLDTGVNSTPAASAFTDLGGTNGGVEITIEQDYKELEVDQTVDVAGARLVKRSVKVKTSLAEPTLDNLLYVLNDGSSATGSGFESYEPEYASSATQPTYRCLVVDGYAPGLEKARRLIVRKVLSTDNVKWESKKDDQSMFEVEWSGYFVSSSIAPFKVIDEA